MTNERKYGYFKESDIVIPLKECKHGYLYLIDCRNLELGVFNKEDNGFIGIRTKFGSRYLFTEYHWDTGAPFGTTNPLEEIEECVHPINDGDDNKDLFNYLDAKLEELHLPKDPRKPDTSKWKRTIKTD